MTTQTVPRPTEHEGAAARATIPIFDAAEVASAAARALERARELLGRIESLPLDAASVERVLDVWDDTSIVLEETFGPISLLNSVHPEKDVRDACDVALVHESSFLTDAFQNEAFYERVRR